MVPEEWENDLAGNSKKLFDTHAVMNYQFAFLNTIAISQLKKKEVAEGKLHGEIKKLEQLLSSQKEMVKKLQEEVLLAPGYEEELSSAREEITSLQARNASLISEGEAMKEKIDHMETSVVDLKSDYAQVISDVIPHVCNQLVGGSELNGLLAKVVFAARQDERCGLLKELAGEGKVDLANHPEYTEQSAALVDAACNELSGAKFSYVAEVAACVEAKPQALLAMLAPVDPPIEGDV